jgi:hypothetical protein
MTSPENLGRQFDDTPAKKPRKVGITLLDHDVTYCNSCAKHENFEGENTQIHYNTDFNTIAGDALFCSGGCGRTIIGQEKYYG